MFLGFWQREKDSNPHIRSQSPLCYLYTIPLFHGAAGRIRTADLILTKDALYRLSYSSINYFI